MYRMDIKPCPFCGSIAEVGGCCHGSFVECRECGAKTKYYRDGITTNDTSMKMAIEAWNTRTT